MTQLRKPDQPRSVDFSLRPDSHALTGVRLLATTPPKTRRISSRCLAHHAFEYPGTGSTAVRACHAVATQLIISNRPACRLEMPESYRKQTTATCSNRHKCRHHFETCHRPGLLQTCQRASRLSSRKPAAWLSGRLAGSTGLKTKQTNDTRSNRQKITQISARARRLLRVWEQYQSGGTRRHAGTAQPSAPAPSTPPWRA